MNENEMNEKISIIVPVYGVEQFIRKCIKSIMNQTYKNIEIILVDDGSDDNCGKICDAFSKMDDRIIVIHQENKGLCAARNAGLNIASGKYIGFIDSDDWILPDMYEYLYKNLKRYNADITACTYFRIKNKKRTRVATDGEVKIFNSDEAIKNIVETFELRTVFWNKLFKKEIFNDIKFPEGKVFEGTNMMHLVLQKTEKVVLLPNAKYYYRDNATSIINTDNIKNSVDYVLGFIKRYNELIEKYPNLKEKMINDVIKNSINLLEVLRRKTTKELREYQNDFSKIYNFIKDNEQYINSMPKVKKTTMWKLNTYKKPRKLKLKLIGLMRFFRKIINKLKKLFKKYLKKKRKHINNKFSVGMSDLTNDDKKIFEELHRKEVYILDEFARICDKHNLKYFLYGGTLLGAVRHKGFIPWDDDIDIVMPREDYDKFSKIVNKELGEEFFYQTNSIEPDYTLLFSKIRLKNTYVKEEKFEGRNMHKGIFIDILPLDLFPKKSRIIEEILLGKFNALNSACQTGRCLSKNPIGILLYRYYTLFPNSVLQKKREKFIKNLCKDKNTPYVCSFGSHYRPVKKRVLQREWFEDAGLKMEFEGKMYSVPKGWNEYLTYLFGPNYMELPPESKQINHFNFYDVKFDEEDKV